MTCEWCIGKDGKKKCRADNESECDFKSLSKDITAVNERIKKEIDICHDLMLAFTKLDESSPKIADEMQMSINDVSDRLRGIQIMKDEMHKLGKVVRYDKLKLSGLALDVMAKSKKVNKFIAKRRKQNGRT